MYTVGLYSIFKRKSETKNLVYRTLRGSSKNKYGLHKLREVHNSMFCLKVLEIRNCIIICNEFY